MSMRTRFIGGVVLAAIAVATWRFMSPSAEVSPVDSLHPVSGPAAATSPVKTPETVIAPDPVPPERGDPLQNNLAASPSAERPAEANFLTERTLVGTKWERDGFGLEFGAAGKLLIGGRERARWSVAGQRVRLYRDTTGEEHWLDIAGSKLLWNGQEIGRVP